MRKLLVIGAGLAGLSAAHQALKRGWDVEIHEATGHAGGRCRSFADATTGCEIDNGTHLVLGANRALFTLLAECGLKDAFSPQDPTLPFLDLASGERWSVHLNRAFPLPQAKAALARDLWALAWARPEQTLGSVMETSPLRQRFWGPLAEAVLNTPLAEAGIQGMRAVLARTLPRRPAARRPYLASAPLSQSLIEPLLAHLVQRGARLHWHHPLKSVTAEGLIFAEGSQALSPHHRAILALPWSEAVRLKLLPITPPNGLRASPIINLHYRWEDPLEPPLLGLTNGRAQFLFQRHGLLSVTISAAESCLPLSDKTLASEVWAECQRALGTDRPQPPCRIIREKRATLRQTPETEAWRPKAPTAVANLFLAGDWTATGLPCTLEGAILSGAQAARLACCR